MYQHAIKIKRPETREQMPQYAFILKVMQDWCSNYVVDHWSLDGGTFMFFYEEDLKAFVQKFQLKVE